VKRIGKLLRKEKGKRREEIGGKGGNEGTAPRDALFSPSFLLSRIFAAA
jgi:hypothetical protein